MYLEKTLIAEFRSILLSSAYGSLAERMGQGFFDDLSAYFELLYLWNKKMNLTRIFRSRETILDEFLVVPAFYAAGFSGKEGSVLDIGSGNGIPAVFCSLLYPDVSFTWCEIDGKKAIFLGEVKRILNLGNVTVRNSDFKEIDPAFGMVTFKNVSRQESFIASAASLLKGEGSILFQASPESVRDFRNKNGIFTVASDYNIPVGKKTCMVRLSIVPRETI